MIDAPATHRTWAYRITNGELVCCSICSILIESDDRWLMDQSANGGLPAHRTCLGR
jgi:hypothetical protein